MTAVYTGRHGRIDPGVSYGVITDYTSDAVLTNDHAGQRSTNTDATALVELTAPTSPSVGMKYPVQRVAPYPIRFIPAASHSIHGAPVGEYVEILGEGMVTFEYTSAGYWTVVAATAPWVWENGGSPDPYDIGCTSWGAPGASEVTLRYKMPRPVLFREGAPFSQGIAGVAATAQTDFDIRKNDVSFGTMRFAAAGTSATFIMASQTEFVAGDVLTVVAPGTPDATLADVSFVLAGIRG